MKWNVEQTSAKGRTVKQTFERSACNTHMSSLMLESLWTGATQLVKMHLVQEGVSRVPQFCVIDLHLGCHPITKIVIH